MINSSFPQSYSTLEFLSGPLVGSTVSLSKQDTRIGSDQNGNDIVLPDPSIQQYHARIYVNQGQFIIQAYNAQAIVAVNGYAVPEAALSDGDAVSLGASSITFRWTALQNSATPRSVPIPTQNLLVGQQIPATPPQTPALATQNLVTPSQVLPSSVAVSSATEATRYLCAAAHLDEDFREYTIKNVFEEEHLAVGESYGVDIIPVAKWCYAARQRVFYRDLFLLADLLILLASVFLPGLFLLVTGLSVLPLYFASSLLTGAFALTFVLLILLAIPLFVIGLIFRSTRPFLIQIYVLLVFASRFPLLVLFFLIAWGIVLVEQIISYGSQAVPLAKGRFRPDSNSRSLDPRLEQKLRDIFPAQDGNVVVYSGYSPFAGAGITMNGWSFAIDISKGKKEIGGTQKTPAPFKVSELYTEIAGTVQQLRLDNVKLADKLYVNGQSIRDDRNFLSDRFSRPYTQVGSALIEHFKESPLEHIRYYTCIRVTSWDGQMVLSIFVRFKLAGKNLFVEVDYELLPPVKEKYHEIDTIEPTLTASKLLKLAKRTFAPTWLLLLKSPVRVCKYVFHDIVLTRRHEQVENSIKENPAFDYGTRTSLREVASSSRYRLYFQRLDKEMYVKIIERQVLEAITNFLDARNIDTADLKARQEIILNNGTIMTGNTIQGSNVAVGEVSQQTLLATPVSAPARASEKTA